MKKCTKCGETKPRTEFGQDKKRKDGLTCWCLSCKKGAHDPVRKRIADIKRNYGLAPHEYEELLCMCDAKCMVCGMSAREHKATTGTFLCVDHDHETGKVRGLLCRECNAAIGKLQEDPELVLKAYHYLTK